MNETSNDKGLRTAILVFLLVLGFVVGFLISGLPRPSIVRQHNYLSPGKAAGHIMAYLQDELPGEGTEVELLSIEDHYNLYRLKITVNEHPFLVYATKDGRLLFTEIIDTFPPLERALPERSHPEIEIFVMPLDPAAAQARQELREAARLFEERMDLRIRYMVLSDLGEDQCLDEDQRYCSHGGREEIQQMMHELCLAEHHPDRVDSVLEAFDALVIEGSLAEGAVAEQWTALVAEAGMDVSLMEDCVAERGFEMLDEQLAERLKKRPVRTPRRYVDAFGEYQTESVLGQEPLALVVNGMIVGQAGELHHLTSENYRAIICLAFTEADRPDFCLEEDQAIEDDLQPTEQLNDDLHEASAFRRNG